MLSPPPMTSTTLLRCNSAPAALPPPLSSPSPRPAIPPASPPHYHRSTILDSFHGVPLRWTSRAFDTSSSSSSRSSSSDHRSLELSFHNHHRDAIYSQYFPHVIDEASRIQLMGHDRRLYTNRPGSHGDDHHRLWSSIPFAHPATFDALAIDPALRNDLRSDLFCFIDCHEHYAHVDRAWKHGYLLHGLPRTGKTNLITAIANLLKFDVYDLELTVCVHQPLAPPPPCVHQP